MTINVIDDTSTDRAISAIEVIDNDGVNQSIIEVRIIDSSGVDRVVFTTGAALSAVATPDLVTGDVYSPGSPQAITSPGYVTVIGGTPPYTITWTASAGWTALTPTATSTTFRSPGVAPGVEETGTAYADVSDALGATATSNTINLSAINTYAPL